MKILNKFNKEELEEFSKEELITYIFHLSEHYKWRIDNLEEDKWKLDDEIEDLESDVSHLESKLENFTGQDSLAHELMYEKLQEVLKKYSPQEIEQILDNFLFRGITHPALNENEELEKHIELLDEEIQDKDDEITDLKEKIEELEQFEEKNQELNEEIEKLEEQVESLQTQLEESINNN